VAADRIVVLGAGSVGCLIGGCWQAAGLPVSFIGRPRIANDIAVHGLTVSDYSGWQAHFTPDEVDYSTGPERLAQAGIIALCVKSAATADAAREIAAHGREGALVMSFQDGISNVDVLKRELGSRFEVVRGMVP
jgi:2-dehydropantoate 2-reductase